MVVTPLGETQRDSSSIPDSDKTELNLDSNLELKQNRNSPEPIHTWITTGRDMSYTNMVPALQFRKLTLTQRARTHKLIREGKLQYWGGLHLDVILPIVSERQIYHGRDRRKFCEATCQLKLHYQRAIYYGRNINYLPRLIIRTHLTILINCWDQFYQYTLISNPWDKLYKHTIRCELITQIDHIHILYSSITEINYTNTLYNIK